MEAERLFNAVKYLVDERLHLRGKDEFVDIHGMEGKYTPKMGPKMKGICMPCMRDKH